MYFFQGVATFIGPPVVGEYKKQSSNFSTFLFKYVLASIEQIWVYSKTFWFAGALFDAYKSYNPGFLVSLKFF